MSSNVDVAPAVRAAIDATREKVAALHAELPRYGLVVWTAGNVSEPVPGARPVRDQAVRRDATTS